MSAPQNTEAAPNLQSWLRACTYTIYKGTMSGKNQGACMQANAFDT